MKKVHIIKLIKKHKPFVMGLVGIFIFFVLSKIKHGILIGSILIIASIAFMMIANIKNKTKKKSINKGQKLLSNSKKPSSSKKKITKGKKKPLPKKKIKILKIILISVLVFFLLGLIGICYFLFLVVKGAPEFNPQNLYQKEATIIYDKDGEIITKIGSEIRLLVNYDDLPQVLIDSIIATEDARFFQHNGFDLPRFLRASSGFLTGDAGAGGGSTLSMQLSKNMFTSTVSSGFDGVVRKFTDIYVSIFELEKKYTKYEIIEFYANSNYLGSGAYGVEQASLVYFGKSVKDINLTEAALLTGLFNAPGALDPNINPEGAERRRNVVLELMERHNYITNEERKIASSISVESMLFKHEIKPTEFMGFINTVTDEVEERTGYNPYVVPMDIYTTMDREKQIFLDGIFNGTNYTWENELVQGATAVIDVDTGEIVAIGAGRNQQSRRTFNYATMSKRHIGSSAKPLYDYGPAIEHNGWSTYQLIVDEPTNYSSGSAIRNWDYKYEGMLTLRSALAKSRNTTALKTFQATNRADIVKFSTSLGLSPESEGDFLHEAHALGGYTGESPLSMAVAYASFANGGYHVEPRSFTKIVYKETGDEFENKMVKNRVMNEATAYMIIDLLTDSRKIGLGSYYNINGVLYGAKTGTSNFTPEIKKQFGLPKNAINDLWIASSSAKYAYALWYGYGKINSEFYTKFGSRQHHRLFNAIGKGIYTENKGFTRPKSVKSIGVEKDSFPAQLPSPFTPSNMIITELFRDGTEPVEVSSRFNRLTAPSDLTITEMGNDLILNWNHAPYPNHLSKDYLLENYQPLFRNNNYLESYINRLLSTSQDILGVFGYNIYVVNGETDTFLAFTTDTTYSINKYMYGSKTFKVQAAYSKFKGNESDAISEFFEAQEIVSTLNVSETLTLPIGGVYIEPVTPVKVYLEGIDITPSTTITKQYKNEEDIVVATINTSLATTYKVIYTVSYSGYEKKLTRYIIIE